MDVMETKTLSAEDQARAFVWLAELSLCHGDTELSLCHGDIEEAVQNIVVALRAMVGPSAMVEVRIVPTAEMPPRPTK